MKLFSCALCIILRQVEGSIVLLLREIVVAVAVAFGPKFMETRAVNL